MNVTLDSIRSRDWSVHVHPLGRMSRGEYAAFVEQNPDLRIERTAEGEVIVMPPAHSRTGRQNLELARQVGNWAVENGSGEAFDSSSGFDLPCGSNRSPDVSWVRKSRLDLLTEEEKRDYYPLCPDFVIELRSSSDRLRSLQAKMREYIENGAVLGWLIDPLERTVHVYRPNREPEILFQPDSVSGDPELPGLTIRLAPVWR